MNKLKLRFTREDTAVAIVLIIGALLRIRQYLTGRSLWLDEAMLALNIINRNFLELFHPLDYDQGSPIGFLIVEKFFNLLFGKNELVLRIFPLILGLLSLWVFYLLLKRFTSGASLITTLALFVLNPRLIYYSSEVKQYIADVFVTIVLLLITVNYVDAPSRKKLGLITIAGLGALWFSHPTLFTLAGIGSTLLYISIKKYNSTNIRLILGIGGLWLTNIGILYSLTLGNLQRNSFMLDYWQDAFAPIPFWINLIWYWNAFQANADLHLAVTFAPLLLFLLMLTGWLFLFNQKRVLAIVIASTLLFSLLASSLRLYPSLERMVLFLTPIKILLIGMFLEFTNQRLRNNRIASLAVIVAITFYLSYGAIQRTLNQFISPKYFEHIRPAMDYLQNAWKEGDSMYISTYGVPAFEYYATLYNLGDVVYISGQKDEYINPPAMLETIDVLRDEKRVWILMSHVYEKDDFNEHDFLFQYLKTTGTKKRVFIAPGTSVYLYLFDLSQ